MVAAIQSHLGTAVVTTNEGTVTDFPKAIRTGSARTVANGSAIYLRIYALSDVEMETPLRGTGSLLFEDATNIKIGFLLKASDTIEVELPVTWVESVDDAYFLITWDVDSFENATLHVTGSNTSHEWGLNVSWTDDDALTVAEGVVKIQPKLVSR